MVTLTDNIMTCELIGIMQHLTRGGLDGWIVPCYTLLIHFYGLESAIEDKDEEPEFSISESVRASIREKPHRRERTLRERLCDLPMTRYRARSNDETWQPLEEPLICFQHRHELRGEECRFWRDRQGRPNPSATDIESWLDRLLVFHAAKTPQIYPIQ